MCLCVSVCLCVGVLGHSCHPYDPMRMEVAFRQSLPALRESLPLSWEPGLLLSPAFFPGSSKSRAAPDVAGKNAGQEGRRAGLVGEGGVSG